MHGGQTHPPDVDDAPRRLDPAVMDACRDKDRARLVQCGVVVVQHIRQTVVRTKPELARAFRYFFRDLVESYIAFVRPFGQRCDAAVVKAAQCRAEAEYARDRSSLAHLDGARHCVEHGRTGGNERDRRVAVPRARAVFIALDVDQCRQRLADASRSLSLVPDT